jgi:hypothetical protein
MWETKHLPKNKNQKRAYYCKLLLELDFIS